MKAPIQRFTLASLLGAALLGGLLGCQNIGWHSGVAPTASHHTLSGPDPTWPPPPQLPAY